MAGELEDYFGKGYSCADIRKKGTSSKVCPRLGLLAAAKAEDLITSFEVPDKRP
ncbi:MAG: hypothetical protein WBC70_18370 [Candidatus Aminicenantales bacterium]